MHTAHKHIYSMCLVLKFHGRVKLGRKKKGEKSKKAFGIRAGADNGRKKFEKQAPLLPAHTDSACR